MLGFPLVQWKGFRFRSPSKPQSLVSPSITPRRPQNLSQSRRRPDKQPARQLLLLSRALGKRRGAGRSSFGRCRQTEQLLSICSAARACVSNCVFRTKAPLGAPLATNNLNKIVSSVISFSGLFLLGFLPWFSDVHQSGSFPPVLGAGLGNFRQNLAMALRVL